MTLRKTLTALLAATAGLAAMGTASAAATIQPQAAAPAGGVTAGARVVDTAGGEVGTVASVTGDTAIIQTDRHKVAYPVASFTPHEGNLIIAVTRNDLNTAADQAAAQAAQAVTVGAMVRDTAGGTVGTIDKVEGENITVKLPSGALVALPRASFAAQPTGPVIAMTAAQLQAQVDAATPAAPATEGEGS